MSPTRKKPKNKDGKRSKKRDETRQNKANSVVKATMLSVLCKDGLHSIQNISSDMHNIFEYSDVAMEIAPLYNQLKDILSICLSTVESSSRYYMRCSTYIKQGAKEIANNENAVLKRAVKFTEYHDLESDMDHFDPIMLDMYKKIQYTPKSSIRTTSPPNETATLTKTFNQGHDLSSTPTVDITDDTTMINTLPKSVSNNIEPCHLSSYTANVNTQNMFTSPYQYIGLRNNFVLPTPFNNEKRYSPLESIQYIVKLADNKFRLILDLPPNIETGIPPSKRVTESLIINLMIMKGRIPINRSSMYKLLSEYKCNGCLNYKHWRQQNKTGPKPNLKRSSYTDMVDTYHKKNDGGLASSRNNLENSVNTIVKDDWNNNPNKKNKRDDLPVTSMSRIVNRVMALEKFNIMNKVSNKTQSRCAAEFSVRSTIAYMMTVVTTHFINAKPSIFHSKHNEIKKHPLYLLLSELNKKTLGVQLDESQLVELTYVLPHLITSTDECSLFITNQVINNKVTWFFTARPTSALSPNVNSSRRDEFTTDLYGDAHLRGLRISLNNTFSAGGQCAPIFACIFGLKPNEMPGDEIVFCSCKGLVAASNMNGSVQDGYIVFIRGKFEPSDNNDDISADSQSCPSINNIPTTSLESSSNANPTVDLDPTQNSIPVSTNVTSLSKESRVAKLYREKVYYPFIKKIRVNHYNMSEKDDTIIPDNLTAVSWMDGCHGQLKLITTEEVMIKEKDLKIVSCKHSPARTAVEQAADVGPMHKMVKSSIKKMTCIESENSPVYFRISNILKELEDTSDATNKRNVILPLHKKNAILIGLSKLPIAMASAFTSHNIQSAFKDNGQLDPINFAIPNTDNLAGTYRGSIGNEHYLNDTHSIIREFYEEAYLNGKINESSYDKKQVVNDMDTFGNVVSRDFLISRENCQRSKVLSADTQRKERLQLKYDIGEKELIKKNALYTNECKKYILNKECEELIKATYYYEKVQSKIVDQVDTNYRPSFVEMQPHFTTVHFGRHNYKGQSKKKPNCDQLKAFIQVRTQVIKYKNGTPVYGSSLHNIKKDGLIDLCMGIKLKPVQPRLFPIEPQGRPKESSRIDSDTIVEIGNDDDNGNDHSILID